MTNHHREQPTPPNQAPPSDEIFAVAFVPVKVRCLSGDILIYEYEDVVDLEFMDTTTEGEKNIALFLYFYDKKGFTCEDAVFKVASNTVSEDETRRLVDEYRTGSPPPHLGVQVLLNGTITYEKAVYEPLP